jgi:hypothetical protein
MEDTIEDGDEGSGSSLSGEKVVLNRGLLTWMWEFGYILDFYYLIYECFFILI